MLQCVAGGGYLTPILHSEQNQKIHFIFISRFGGCMLQS